MRRFASLIAAGGIMLAAGVVPAPVLGAPFSASAVMAQDTRILPNTVVLAGVRYWYGYVCGWIRCYWPRYRIGPNYGYYPNYPEYYERYSFYGLRAQTKIGARRQPAGRMHMLRSSRPGVRCQRIDKASARRNRC
jgi:hypothetical protein